MRKVLSPDQLSTLLDGQKEDQDTGPSLEEIVTPTANDLLALTEAAISDVNGVLPLTDDQRQALHTALRQRLIGTLSDAPKASPELSPDEAL
ncbi:MAG: hypothetical protein AAF234_15610 [Pseudomonadota bacterium]